MPWYEWINTEEGLIRHIYCPVEERDIPPDNRPGWVRRYTGIGIDKVEGAGNSPARQS